MRNRTSSYAVQMHRAPVITISPRYLKVAQLLGTRQDTGSTYNPSNNNQQKPFVEFEIGRECKLQRNLRSGPSPNATRRSTRVPGLYPATFGAEEGNRTLDRQFGKLRLYH